MRFASGASPDVDPSADHSINQRLFETSLDLILVVDRAGNFLRVSPSVETILGYPPDRLIGRSAIEFVHPDDLESTRNEMRMARRGHRTRNFDCRYMHRDGRVVTLAWTGVWYEPAQQHFFIGRDITERIRLERQLAQAQRMEAIGQLTGGIAHDFNNILTIIIGMNDTLGAAVAHAPNLAELSKCIDEAAERGAQLTQRMLAFARKQPLQARSIDLNEIVAHLSEILKPTLGEDIGTRTFLSKDLWPALADPLQLENAIVNLAINARDAMPGGGQLLIETANVELDEEYAAHNVDVAPGDYVALIVTDTGTGMTPEVMEHAFEPFFTTKSVGKGTGLGLSMVYGFVKQSGGHVKIYSETGHGTTVRLYLPRAGGGGDAMPAGTPGEQTRIGGGETILVVEDDANVRKVAVSILQGLGYQVRQAGDGVAALAILQAPERIDLLFTDLVMPNGISGQELLRRAHELRPALPALFATGYSEEFIKAKGGTDENVPLLTKPYRRDKLASAVRSLLRGA